MAQTEARIAAILLVTFGWNALTCVKILEFHIVLQCQYTCILDAHSFSMLKFCSARSRMYELCYGCREILLWERLKCRERRDNSSRDARELFIEVSVIRSGLDKVLKLKTLVKNCSRRTY
jgi:hypothetical protein